MIRLSVDKLSLVIVNHGNDTIITFDSVDCLIAKRTPNHCSDRTPAKAAEGP
jgi:hypothetical protein